MKKRIRLIWLEIIGPDFEQTRRTEQDPSPPSIRDLMLPTRRRTPQNVHGMEARVELVQSRDRTWTSSTLERTCVRAGNALTNGASQTAHRFLPEISIK